MSLRYVKVIYGDTDNAVFGMLNFDIYQNQKLITIFNQLIKIFTPSFFFKLNYDTLFYYTYLIKAKHNEDVGNVIHGWWMLLIICYERTSWTTYILHVWKSFVFIISFSGVPLSCNRTNRYQLCVVLWFHYCLFRTKYFSFSSVFTNHKIWCTTKDNVGIQGNEKIIKPCMKVSRNISFSVNLRKIDTSENSQIYNMELWLIFS